MMWSELEYILVGRQVDKMAVGKAPSEDGKSLSNEERNPDASGYDIIVFMHKRRFKSQLFCHAMGGKESCVGFANDSNTNPLNRTLKYIELFIFFTKDIQRRF